MPLAGGFGSLEPWGNSNIWTHSDILTISMRGTKVRFPCPASYLIHFHRRIVVINLIHLLLYCCQSSCLKHLNELKYFHKSNNNVKNKQWWERLGWTIKLSNCHPLSKPWDGDLSLIQYFWLTKNNLGCLGAGICGPYRSHYCGGNISKHNGVPPVVHLCLPSGKK